MDDKKTFKKDPKKVTAPNNNKPITCQPMMWKIQTVQIRGEIYDSLISCVLCRNWTRCTGELQYIDQYILKDSKTKRKNLALTWIDS